MARALRTAVVAGMTALAVAGCGGEGDGGSRPTTAASESREEAARTRFADDVNAICARFRERLKDAREPRDVRDFDRWAGEAGPILQDGLRSMRDVTAPAGLRADYERYIELGDRQVDVLRRIRALARQTEANRIDTALVQLGNLDDESDALARKLGFTGCVGG